MDDEHDHEHYAFSMDFFTFNKHKVMQTHSRALTLGDTGHINQVNKKLRKKHFF